MDVNLVIKLLPAGKFSPSARKNAKAIDKPTSTSPPIMGVKAEIAAVVTKPKSLFPALDKLLAEKAVMLGTNEKRRRSSSVDVPETKVPSVNVIKPATALIRPETPSSVVIEEKRPISAPQNSSLPPSNKSKNEAKAKIEFAAPSEKGGPRKSVSSVNLKDAALGKRGIIPDYRNSPHTIPSSLFFEAWSFRPLLSIRLNDWRNKVSDTVLNQLAECNTKFNELDISGSYGLVSSKGFSNLLSKSYQLCSLNLNNCMWFDSNCALELTKNCHGLEIINLSNITSINDNIIKILAKGLTRLYDVNLSGCKLLTDVGMRMFLTQHKNIKKLNLSSCNLLTDLTMEVVALIQLEKFDVSNVPLITDFGLSFVIDRNNGYLTELDISDCSLITDVSIRFITERPVVYGFQTHKGFPDMTALKLARCIKVSELSLSWICAGAPNLKILDVSGCVNISSNSMKNVSTMISLRELYIDGCSIDDSGLSLLLEGTEKNPSMVNTLTTLNLSSLKKVSDDGVKCLTKRMKHMIKFTMNDMINVGDEGIIQALKKSSEIKRLYLESCELIGSKTTVNIAIRCKNLVELSLAGCSGLRDEAILELRELRHIEIINLSGCKLLTDIVLRNLPNWSLKQLFIVKLPLITNDGIQGMTEFVPELEVLDASKCHGLTLDGVLNIVAASLPNLKTLNLYHVPCEDQNNIFNQVEFVLADSHSGKFLRGIKKSPEKNFFGFTNTPNADAFRKQATYLEREKLENDAVLLIQSKFRGHLTRIAFRKIVHAKFKADNIKARDIQRVYRGHRGRMRYSRYKKCMSTFAVRHQYLYRSYKMRCKNAKARNFRQHKVKLRSFKWLNTWVVNQIKKRDGMLANEKMEKAERHYKKTLMNKVLIEWFWAAEDLKREKIALNKAIKFWVNKNAKPCLIEWFWLTKDALLHRRKLVSIFMCCISCDTYNSIRQEKNRFWAKAQGEKSKRLRFWRFWIDFMDMVVEQNEKARKNSFKLLCKPGHMGPSIWWSWKEYISQRRIQKEKVKHGLEFWLKSNVERGFKRLHSFARNRIDYRISIKRCIKHWQCSKESKGLRTWHRYAVTRVDTRRKILQAFGFLLFTRRKKCFNAWREWYGDMLERRHLKAQAAALIRRVHGKKMLMLWKAAVEDRHDVARSVLTGMYHNRLLSGFEKWVAVNKWKRDVEDKIRFNFLKETRAATRIQARWRGRQSRRDAKIYEAKATVAAIKLQRIYRGHRGRLRHKRHIRYRDLREFVKKEYEFERIEQEDQFSKIMEIAHKAAAKMQGLYRGKHGRHLAYVARQQMVIKRALQRQIDMENQIKEHERLMEERKKQKEFEIKCAIKLQSVFRRKFAKLAVQELKRVKFLSGKAVLLQAAFRGNRARRRAAALRRIKKLDKETLRRTQTAASILRLFGFRNRSQQENGAWLLRGLGLDPSTYGVHDKELLQFDWVELKMYYAFQKSLWKARNNLGLQADLLHNYEKEIAAIIDAKVGDAVRIIETDNPYLAETGVVINSQPNLGNGGQVQILMDRTNTVAYFRYRTLPTKYESGKPTMIKIKANKFNRYTPLFFKENGMAIRELAAKLKEERMLNWAARLLQNNWRILRSKRKRKALIEANKKASQKKKERIEKLLKFLRMRNKRGGRLLVRLRITKESELPLDLVEEPLFSKEIRVRYDIMRRYIMRNKESDHALLERFKYYKKMRRVHPGTLRWRRRNIFTRAFFYFWNIICSPGTRIARKLRSTALTRHSSDAQKDAYELLNVLANIIGGSELNLTETQKKQWTGNWFLKQFKYSSHVRHSNLLPVGGYTVYHGEWKNGKPNGKGVSRFLVGDKYAECELPKSNYFDISLKEVQEWVKAREEKRKLKELAKKGISSENIEILLKEENKEKEDEGDEKVKKGILEIQDVTEEKEEKKVERKKLEDKEGEKKEGREDGEKKDEVDTEKKKGEEMEGEKKEGEKKEGEKKEGEKKEGEKENKVGEVNEKEEDKKELDGGLSKEEEERIAENVKKVKLKDRIYKWIKGKKDKLMEKEKEPKFHPLNPALPLFHQIEGEFVDGVVGGNVFIYYFGGDLYDGPWVDEDETVKETHWGQYTTSTKFVYEGATVTPHFIAQEASGRFKVTKPDGEEYDGYLLNNMRHGYGICYYRNKSEYEGEWRAGMRHGKGTLMMSNGEEYTGDWEEDDMHGLGRLVFQDKTVYEGLFGENDYHGFGKLVQPNGDTYEGEWLVHQRHGKGKQVYSDGREYDGFWSSNMYHGEGFMQWPNGDSYMGPWCNNKMHGRGLWTKTIKNGWKEEREGFFFNGERTDWLSKPVCKEATEEFISRYPKGEEDFSGMFSMLVARKLPDLPNAVDGTNKRVREIIYGIVKAAGYLAGDEVILRCKKELEVLKPLLTAERQRVTTLTEEYEDTCEELEDQREVVDATFEVYDAQLNKSDRLRKEIDDYWLEHKEEVSSWRKAAQEILNLGKEDFLWIRIHATPPSFLAKLMEGILLLWQIDYDWSVAQNIISSSEVNSVDQLDKEALMIDYDVKLKILLKRYDVYKLARNRNLLRDIRWEFFYDYNLRPEAIVMKDIGKAAPAMCNLLRSTLLYAELASEIVENIDELAKNEKKLLVDLTALEKEENAFDELEIKKEGVHLQLLKSRGIRKDLERQVEELCNTLDTAIMFEEQVVLDSAWSKKAEPNVKKGEDGEDRISDTASESGRLYAGDLERIKSLQGGLLPADDDSVAEKPWVDPEPNKDLALLMMGVDAVEEVVAEELSYQLVEQGWIKELDATTGDKYFYNEITGESKWEMPTLEEEFNDQQYYEPPPQFTSPYSQMAPGVSRFSEE